MDNDPNGVIAIFTGAASAHDALTALTENGIDLRGVSVLGPGAARGDRPPELDETSPRVKDVTKYWAEWGAIVGASAGAAVVAVPLMAAIVGLGPFALALAALPLASAAAGALTSAFVGLGVHEAHARRYEHALRDGKVVMVVHTDDVGALEDARAVLAARAESIEVHGLRELRGT